MRKIIQLYEDYTSLEGSLFVYSLSFSLLLALAPALILFVMTFHWFFLDTNLITETIIHYFPKELIEPFIRYLIRRNYFNYLASVLSVAVSLWLASRSTYSFNLIVAQREEIECTKWMIRVKSIIQFLGIVLYVLVSVIIVTRLSLISFIYVPIFASSLTLMGFYLFYHSLTFIEREKSFGILGALFTTISLFLSGVLFFQVLNQFSHVKSVYGPLSSLVVLFLSIYLMASIIYLGHIINELYADERKIMKKNTLIVRFLESVYDKVLMVFKNK